MSLASFAYHDAEGDIGGALLQAFGLWGTLPPPLILATWRPSQGVTLHGLFEQPKRPPTLPFLHAVKESSEAGFIANNRPISDGVGALRCSCDEG